MFLGIDPLYWIMMIPVLILSAFSSFRVKSVYNKFSRVLSRSGLTGAEVASEILRRNRLSNVSVTETRGFLSDHYDPGKKVVRLSPNVFRSNSIAAIGVAAHETGHAIQHANAQPRRSRKRGSTRSRRSSVGASGIPRKPQSGSDTSSESVVSHTMNRES